MENNNSIAYIYCSYFTIFNRHLGIACAGYVDNIACYCMVVRAVLEIGHDLGVSHSALNHGICLGLCFGRIVAAVGCAQAKKGKE
jgi:hypothetical protein